MSNPGKYFKWVSYLFLFQALLVLVTLLFDLVFVGALKDFFTVLPTGQWPGTSMYEDPFLVRNVYSAIAFGFNGLLFLTLFIIAAFRANIFLRDHGRKDMRFSPPWAIVCWFIPLVNMILPFLLLDELFRASNTASPANRWRQSPHNLDLGLLWVCGFLSMGVELFRVIQIEHFFQSMASMNTSLTASWPTADINNVLLPTIILSVFIQILCPIFGFRAFRALATRFEKWN